MKKHVLLVAEIILLILMILLLPAFIYELYSKINEINIGGSSISHGWAITITSLKYAVFLTLTFTAKRFINIYQDKKELRNATKAVKRFILNRQVVIWVTTIVLLISALLFSVYSLQRSLVYFPSYYEQKEVKLESLDIYTKIDIKDGDQIKYSGWGKLDESVSQTVVYFGGNTESSALLFEKHHDNGWNVFNDLNFIMIDYPGFGKSKGSPTEASLFSMATYTIDHLINDLNISVESINIVGYSLGTGVASYISSLYDVNKLLLIAPYSSMTDTFNKKLPIFYGPFKNLVRDKYDSIFFAENINTKTLIIASKKDKIIKYTLSVKLHNAIDSSEIIIKDNLRHNEFLDDSETINDINHFLNT